MDYERPTSVDTFLRHYRPIYVLPYVLWVLPDDSLWVDATSGETRDEAVNLATRLQSEGISPLLQYSKESSDSIIDIQNTEREIIQCMEAAAALKKPAFIAIKLSGLASYEELRRLERDMEELILRAQLPSPLFLSQTQQILTKYPQLSERLLRISRTADRLDIHLVLDAELRFHGRVDSLPTSAILCSLLNTGKNNFWNTHQM